MSGPHQQIDEALTILALIDGRVRAMDPSRSEEFWRQRTSNAVAIYCARYQPAPEIAEAKQDRLEKFANALVDQLRMRYGLCPDVCTPSSILLAVLNAAEDARQEADL